MKDLVQYDRVVVYLDKISDLIRLELFGGELEKPVITLQKTTGAYGHFETIPMWKDENGNARYEINLGSETITRPIENVVATLIHEYTHYYNHIKGIKDTSRGCTYHNKRFKEEAEKHLIKIDYDSKIGWSLTSPTDELIEWCIAHDLQEIKIGRGIDFASLFGRIGKPTKGGNDSGAGADDESKKKSSTIKYKCPVCGNIIRATKNLDGMLKCVPCDVLFERF